MSISTATMPTRFPSRSSKISELSIEGIQVAHATGPEVVIGAGLEAALNNDSGLEVVHKYEDPSLPESRRGSGLKTSLTQRYLLSKKKQLLWIGVVLAFTIGISAAVVITWLLSRKAHLASSAQGSTGSYSNLSTSSVQAVPSHSLDSTGTSVSTVLPTSSALTFSSTTSDVGSTLSTSGQAITASNIGSTSTSVAQVTITSNAISASVVQAVAAGTSAPANVQFFTGSLGGTAQSVTLREDANQPFAVGGNTFTTFADAVVQSCSSQESACTEAVSKQGKFTQSDCSQQQQDCLAAGNAASSSIVTFSSSAKATATGT